MKTTVKALVIGGGAVPQSRIICKGGWDDVMLLGDELTSVSTWHAAGLLPLFNMSTRQHIHKYSSIS
jgi:dimethylglycine dehydrogenase